MKTYRECEEERVKRLDRARKELSGGAGDESSATGPWSLCSMSEWCDKDKFAPKIMAEDEDYLERESAAHVHSCQSAAEKKTGTNRTFKLI